MQKIKQEKNLQSLFGDEVVFDDGRNVVVDRLTLRNFDAVVNGPMLFQYAYMFLFGNLLNLSVIYGGFDRREHFERTAEQTIVVKEILLRGTVLRNGKIYKLQLFDSEKLNIFSQISRDELEALIKKVLNDIPSELLDDIVKVDLNARNAYLFHKSTGTLTAIQGAKIGNIRMDGYTSKSVRRRQ